LRRLEAKKAPAIGGAGESAKLSFCFRAQLRRKDHLILIDRGQYSMADHIAVASLERRGLEVGTPFGSAKTVLMSAWTMIVPEVGPVIQRSVVLPNLFLLLQAS